MSTNAHDTTKWIASEWEDAYASAVLSGIVGDEAHQKNGGYHISIENNSTTNYSVTRPDDKAPPGTWPRNLAAAIDMSMSATDMKLCSDRLWWAWYDQTDPRRIYINGFNGYFNDGGPAKRYDFVTQQISEASSDHKWHVHLEIRRRYVTEMEPAAKAIVSILKGQPKAEYINSIGSDDMFCVYGDKNSKVQAVQYQLLQLDANCLPQFGADMGYGNETAAALVALGVSATDGKAYGPFEFAALNLKIAQKFGPTNGVTPPLPSGPIPITGTINLPATLQISLPETIPVDGEITITK